MSGYELIIREGKPELDKAVDIAAIGFGRGRSEGLVKSVGGVLNKNQSGLTAHLGEDGPVVGFATFSVYEHPTLGRALYLGGMALDPAMQGKGIGPALLRRAITTTSPRYLTFMTQSPRMYAVGQEFVTGGLFPALDGRPIPSDLESVGQFVAAARGDQFPLNPGKYNNGTPLYRVPPQHPRGEAFFRLLNYEAGDGLFCVGSVALAPEVESSSVRL